MNQSKLFVKNYTPTTLFAEIFISIFCLHMFTRKDTILKIEINTVLTQHFRVNLTLNLLDKLINSVSKDEISFESWVRMQVEVHE